MLEKAKRPHPLLDAIETLYQKQLFEAANVVLGLAVNSNDLSRLDRTRLFILDGILRNDAFQEAQAAKAFREGLELDRFATLPDFAPPKTRRLFEDIKAVLPATSGRSSPLPAEVPTVSEDSGQYLAWIPIGIGAAALATGSGLLIASRVIDGSVRSGTPEIRTAEDLDRTTQQGNAFQTAGAIVASVGGAVLIGGLLWKLSPEYMPLLSWQVMPSEGGFAATLTGHLP